LARSEECRKEPAGAHGDGGPRVSRLRARALGRARTGMPRGVDDEARQPILRAAEGVSSSGAEISSGLRARAPSRDTAAPVPHGDPREVPRWGRAGSRDTAKDAYAVWCERHGAPVGVATWLVVLAAFGFASPLSRADASPATRAACAALLCASLISMALVNRLDPGIVPPSPTDDPIVETLDAAVAAAGDDPHASGAESARAAASEPATLPGGVRRDPVTGQYARLVLAGGGRYGGGDVADVESGREENAPHGLRGDASAFAADENRVAWDWSKCERYCRTCRVWRPPRAAHCRECGWCVERFDHHCGALGNCVGRGNHVWFVVFLCSASCVACLLLVESVRALRDFEWPSSRRSWSDPGCLALVAGVIVYGVCACMSCFAASHVYLCLCDVTTKEILRPKGGVRRGDADADADAGARRLERLCGADAGAGERGLRRCLRHFADTVTCAGCQLKSRVEKRFEARLESRRQ
jgi:hypothetical protein